MDTFSTPSMTLAKAGAVFVVGVGLVAQLTSSPAQAGGKDAALFIGGVLAGVVVTQAIKNSQQNQYSPPPPPPRYVPPSHNPPSYNPPPPRRVVKHQYYDRAEARRIQQALNVLGFNAGVPDGVIGRGTRQAISGFQYQINARPTGVLTAKQKIILFDRVRLASQNRNQQNTGNQNNRNTQNNQNTATVTGTTGSNGSTRQPQTANAQQPQPVNVRQPQNNQQTKPVSSRQGRIRVQQALNALGYPAGKENGRMTAQTRNAIKAFQLDLSHEATGLLSAEQRRILFQDAADLSAESAAPDQNSNQPSFNDS